jgi:transcriptional regulator with XRE-family HTH domain
MAESEPVALLLGDALPPERLSALLRAARRRRGFTRKDVAAMAGVRKARLRAYERGEEAIPPEVCARLAECYGESLTAHVPLRAGSGAADGRLILGPDELALAGASPDGVLEAYAEILRRVRRAKPGEPVPLRAADIAALSAALETDTDTVEARLAAILGCSREEAHALHRELLRRRVVLPVAGLAAGVAALAGVHAAQAAPGDDRRVGPAPAAPTATAPPTTAPAPAAPAPGPVAAPATTVPAAAPATTVPAVEAPPPAPGPGPADVRAAAPGVPEPEPGPPAPLPRPIIDPDDRTPVGVLPGETPVPYTPPSTLPPDDDS